MTAAERSDPVQLWRDISEGVRLLRAGMPVAIPTETVYGLAARIDDGAAIERLFRLKNRPFFDPLIVHITGIDDVSLVAREFPEAARRLAAELWPGPLTIVLPRRDDLNPMICAGLDSVAVRAPAHPAARRIIRRLGVPLAAPSANKFSKTSPTSAAHVRSNFSDDEVFVVDAGPCPVGIESTVVEVSQSSGGVLVEILRPGMIGEEEIKRALPGASVGMRASAASPGNTAEHYRPAIPLVICDESHWPLSAADSARIISALGIRGGRHDELVLDSNAALAARQLYSELHRLGAGSADFLAVVRRNKMCGSHWEAVWDRLRRAASLALDSGV